MTVCMECSSVEGGVVYADDDEDQQMPICACCGMEDSIKHVDEDAGQDR